MLQVITAIHPDSVEEIVVNVQGKGARKIDANNPIFYS